MTTFEIEGIKRFVLLVKGEFPNLEKRKNIDNSFKTRNEKKQLIDQYHQREVKTLSKAEINEL